MIIPQVFLSILLSIGGIPSWAQNEVSLNYDDLKSYVVALGVGLRENFMTIVKVAVGFFLSFILCVLDLT